MNGNFLGRLFTGLVIIGVGILFLLRQAGQIDISIGELFSTYWPVILIVLGIKQLLSGCSQGAGWGGGVMVLIGVFFLGRNLDWIGWSTGEIIPYLVPFVIIVIGLRMILKPRSKRQTPPVDDWQSYRPYTNDESVPPAPPLHPDPTGVDPNFTEEDPEPIPSYKKDYKDYKKAYKEGKHYYKEHVKKAHGHCKRHGKEHVEWWNYNDPNVQNRTGFIGDIHLGHDYWELKPMNISHFIGDTILDLTKAQVPFGETKINISSFIGDVKVYVPNDYEIGIQVVSSAFIGDVKILGQKEGGLFTNINIQSPLYSEADKKIKLVVSTFIGDVRVTKVG